MCEICDRQSKLSRRGVFGALGGGMAVAASLRSMTGGAMAADGAKSALTPAQALDALKSGNERYTTNVQSCVADLAKRRGDVSKGQAPWATIVSCADSRVPPELLFGGLGLGELFVVRNAGNLVDTAAMGTIEYGAAVLGAPLLVVLGHQRCGAVAAACDVVSKNATYPGSIGPMIEPIVPAALSVKDKQGDFVDLAVRENARRTAARLAVTGPIVPELAKAGKLKVVSAYYALDTGKVEFFDVA
jgi:carbonic anhydrase